MVEAKMSKEYFNEISQTCKDPSFLIERVHAAKVKKDPTESKTWNFRATELFQRKRKSERLKVRLAWVFWRATLGARCRRITFTNLRGSNTPRRSLLTAKVLFRCEGENKDMNWKTPCKSPFPRKQLMDDLQQIQGVNRRRGRRSVGSKKCAPIKKSLWLRSL